MDNNSTSQNIPENVDAAIGEFLAKLANIDDYVRPTWELEIKEEIWDKFAINTLSEQSMFDSELAEIRNPSRRKNVN
jgi:hypothetical protein